MRYCFEAGVQAVRQAGAATRNVCESRPNSYGVLHLRGAINWREMRTDVSLEWLRDLFG